MANPPKPWEKAGVNSHNFDSSSFRVSDEYRNSKALPDLSDSSRRLPPPLPLRPSQPLNNYRSTYNNFYSPYSSLYNSYGMRNSLYSDMGFNNIYYGGPNDPNSQFIQLAQESTRPAFQSIESIVHAVASVSMMLESTYQAIHSSFNAVLGVADHFTRLKSHFIKIYSAFALLRALKWLYHKVLVLLKLRESGLAEDIWKEVFISQESLLSDGADKSRSAWPVLLFCLIAFGGPWLIWQLIQSIVHDSKVDAARWASGAEDYFVGIAQYDFVSDNENEISFKSGQHLRIAPKEFQPRVRGWLLASVNGQKSGLVPANYIQILGKKQGTNSISTPDVENGSHN